MWDSSASVATYNDYAVVAVLTAMCPAVRWILHRNMFKFIVYSAFLVTGVCVTYHESWAWSTTELWQSWPHHEIKPLMKWLYSAELAFYTSSIAMLVMWEVRRKDFQVMLLHHITTTALIAASYYFNYLRIGILVMMLHDSNDILMEAAKTAKYCALEALSTAFFGLFVLSWAATRLTVFPFTIIRSTLVESVRLLGYHPPGYRAFNLLLCVLLLIHCYWFYLILNVVWVKLVTGDTRDIREDDFDGEDD